MAKTKTVTPAMQAAFKAAVEQSEELEILRRRGDLTAKQFLKKSERVLRRLEAIHDKAPNTQISTESAILHLHRLRADCEQDGERQGLTTKGDQHGKGTDASDSQRARERRSPGDGREVRG